DCQRGHGGFQMNSLTLDDDTFTMSDNLNGRMRFTKLISNLLTKGTRRNVYFTLLFDISFKFLNGCFNIRWETRNSDDILFRIIRARDVDFDIEFGGELTDIF